MKCKKAIELIPALSLGDLDVEEKRSLENHLADCISCRREADRELGVIAELSSLPVLETAEARRDRTVEAMSQEHAERIERILLQPRKGSGRIRIWGAAAAVLLAVLVGGGFFLLDRIEASVDLQVVEIQGQVQVYRDGVWEALRPDMELSSGDRVVTQRDSVAFFLVNPNQSDHGRLVLNEKSSLSVGKGANLVLDRGEMFVELKGGNLDVRTFGKETVSLSKGACVVGLRETMVLVLGSSVKKPSRIEGADVVYENQPFSLVATRIGEVTGVAIFPALPEVGQRRVWFYGVSTEKDLLLEKFKTAMRGQGIQIRAGKDRHVADLIAPVEKRQMSRRLFARVNEGEASLNSDQGVLLLRKGEEGFLQPGGVLAKAKWDSGDLEWIRPGFYENRVPDPVLIPAKLSFRMIGKDAQGRPIVECNIHGSEIYTVLQGRSAVVSIEDATLTGEGEFLVPVRIRVE